MLVHGVLPFHAQTSTVGLVGKVEDAFLHMPLPGARVTVFSQDSTMVQDSVRIVSFADRSGRPVAAQYVASVPPVAKEYLVRATLDGYDEAWARVGIEPSKASNEVPTLRMRKVRQIDLGEVEVRATKVKMFYNGDTLVYNADAFNLPQGSMLDDLIRQMPGVTLSESGEIFVNGRKIDELLLGSRSFLRGNKGVLMENLPYYTVRNLKVYERQTDKSVALGCNAESPKFVMDVNLKENYRRGYIGNAEVGAGTAGKWLGRAFAMGFTDRLRLTLLGNLNNVSETRHIGQSGSWTPGVLPQSVTTTRSVRSEIDYEAKDKRLRDAFYAEYTSLSDRRDVRQSQELFLPGNPVSNDRTNAYSHDGALSLNNQFTLTRSLYLRVDAGISHTLSHGKLQSSRGQWNDCLTTSMLSLGMDECKIWKAFGELSLSFGTGSKKSEHLSLYAKMEHADERASRATRYDTHSYAQSQRRRQFNTDDARNRTTWGYACLDYTANLYKNVGVQIGDGLLRRNIYAKDALYHPDTLAYASQLDMLNAFADVRNSYESNRKVTENKLKITFFMNASYKLPGNPVAVTYRRWSLDFTVPLRHEMYRYSRGSMDTLARQNTVYLNTMVSYRAKTDGGRGEVSATASHARQSPDVADLVTYRDDSSPLVVKLGNPHLGGNASSMLRVSYLVATRRKTQYNANASLNYTHRGTAQSLTYNPESGVYTYKPMNIHGPYSLSGSFGINGSVDKKDAWTYRNNIDAGLLHSVDFSMLQGENASVANVVNTVSVHDGACVQYDRKALNARLCCDLRWRHSTGRMYDFSTLDAFDFHYGGSVRYTIPRMNTTFSADAMMYGRRGYGTNLLNTDDFLVNAYVSQPLLKGRLVARLDAYDLLHNISNVRYDVSAQGRTETWYNSLPHYLMLHLTYHFSKK